jgi:PIN domain nuclease of toxin-antitoxin system
MTEAVLDASAVLAVLFNEPGAEIVQRALEAGPCAVSAVNLSEITAKLVDRGANEEAIRLGLDSIAMEVHPFDEASAIAAGMLRNLTRPQGLSLGDRACIGLARSLDLPVMTADRKWDRLNLGIPVRLARPEAET